MFWKIEKPRHKSSCLTYQYFVFWDIVGGACYILLLAWQIFVVGLRNNWSLCRVRHTVAGQVFVWVQFFRTNPWLTASGVILSDNHISDHVFRCLPHVWSELTSQNVLLISTSPLCSQCYKIWDFSETQTYGRWKGRKRGFSELLPFYPHSNMNSI